MTIMFVANASPQVHEFYYRIPEEHKTRKLTIQPFGQIKLSDDMNQEQISAVIHQHEPYGFVSSNDVKSGKTRKAHTRLCYSFGQPVSQLIIDALYQNNYRILDDQGKELRQSMAVVGNSALTSEVNKARQNGLEAGTHNFEMTIQEEDDSGSREGTSIGVLSEGYRVAQDPNTPTVPVKRGKGRKA